MNPGEKIYLSWSDLKWCKFFLPGTLHSHRRLGLVPKPCLRLIMVKSLANLSESGTEKTYSSKEKKDKKRKPQSNAGVGKMQGWSVAELRITLAFLCSVGRCGACITLLIFWIYFLLKR